MNKIILHRNYGSPYCQKIITLLDYCQLEWYSELTSKGIPRPVQQTLSGNYSRRVPLLQIGADIYCDTKEICHQIALISGQNELSYYHLSAKQQAFSNELEYEFGKAIVALLNPLEIITSYFKYIPMKDAFEFIVDRLKVKRHTKGKSPLETKSKDEWEGMVRYYFKRIDGLLEKNNYLSQTSHPNYLDFTAYTHIWYSYRLNQLKHAKGLNNIKIWLKKMNQFDTGKYHELAKGEALRLACDASPKTINESFLRSSGLNQPITLVVNDALAFIMEPINETLVGRDNDTYILKRTHPAIGIVHLHIPSKCHGACG